MAYPVARVLGHLYRRADLVCRCSSLPNLFNQRSMPKSTSSPHQILSQSTILLQDGLDIQELPLVIRRMEAREFPFRKAMYGAEDLRQASAQDEAFRLQLMDCQTVRQVCTLLEVPGDQVTAYSAAFALHRLCSLQECSSDDIKSFMKKALFSELCDTVVKDVQTLHNHTLVVLAKCYLTSTAYEQRYIDMINDELERRVGDGVLDMADLCDLIVLLSTHARGSQVIVNNIWIHLSNRFKEIDHNNIVSIYKACQFISPSQKFIWKVLDKRLQRCWWKLDSADVASVMQRITMGNYYSGAIMSSFGKWTFMNIHNVIDAELKEILAAYTYFNFSDTNFFHALERYVSARAPHMNKALLGMVMEYCRQRRFLSSKIFDAVANDFQSNGHKYDSYEVVNALRPFGQLNYPPSDTRSLFLMAEDVLTESFADFSVASMVELLASFVYLERFPVNFVKKIFTPHFMAKIKAIPDTKMRQRAGKHLMQLQAAVKLEFPKQYINFVDEDTLGLALTFMAERQWKFHQDMLRMLTEMLGPAGFKDVEVPRGTPHLIDFEILCKQNNGFVQKIAMVGMMPEYYCTNTRNMLGEYAMRRRHLIKLGYTVVEVSYEQFFWKERGYEAKRQYLQQLLEPYIELPTPL